MAQQGHPSATEPRSSATEKPKEKGRAVQLVVKINEFRYRLALFRSSCVTTAIVSGTLDSYISSTPLYNKTLFDLRNKIRLLGFAHPASYICKIILLPARRVHLSCSRCAADVEGTCPCLHFSCQMEICGGAAELLLLRAWVSFFFFLIPPPRLEALGQELRLLVCLHSPGTVGGVHGSALLNVGGK